MDRWLSIGSPTEMPQMPAPDPLLLEPATLRRDMPDTHWVVVGEAGTLRARCSLWWTRTPFLRGRRVGLIGHYADADAAAGRLLLEQASRELATRGCHVAIGPMDGSTWRRYRLVTERGPEPPFFLEPDNPGDWPHQFLASGFQPIAHYISAVNDDLGHEDPRVHSIGDRLTTRGVRVRPVDPRHIEDDLRRIYAVSAVSFRNNFLYTPIVEEEFLTRYRALLPAVCPELVLIAEKDERPVGFIFAIPDLTQADRGHAVDTVIVKTLAVLPERTGAGLGSLLLTLCHRTARQLGFTRAIHALMHAQNASCNLSRRHARPMRRYALYGKALEASS